MVVDCIQFTIPFPVESLCFKQLYGQSTRRANSVISVFQMRILPDALTRLQHRIEAEQLLAPLWPVASGIAFLDQTRLPHRREVLTAQTAGEVAGAIRRMQVCGSGAIGIAGAFGTYLAVRSRPDRPEVWAAEAHDLKFARPTAVILQTAVEEVLSAARSATDPVEAAATAAAIFFERQLAFERLIGSEGARVIPDGSTVLTHCYSGALAGAGYGGGVLSIIRGAVEAGKSIRVIVQETRPYLQGAGITAYELKQLGFPVSLATNGMAGALMQSRRVDVCVVGSHRVALNGDLANEAGTYLIALAAREHGIPFYTTANRYNIDPNCASGEQIPIEFRPAQEVVQYNRQPVNVEGVEALYPSFDITPAALIRGIITEQGVIEQPFEPKLRRLVNISPYIHTHGE